MDSIGKQQAAAELRYKLETVKGSIHSEVHWSSDVENTVEKYSGNSEGKMEEMRTVGEMVAMDDIRC